MSAHSPDAITRVAPDQPPSNWASWLRDIARLLNLVTYLVDKPALTVATLPTDAMPGTMMRVTDLGPPLAWGSVATGGGTTFGMVWFDGTNWKIFAE